MAADGVIRASDSDRERVVVILRDGYAAGRLSLAEFDDRTTAAFSARTWDELRALTRDLPGDPALGADVPASRPAQRASQGRPLPGPDDQPDWAGRHEGMPRLLPALPIALVWLAISLTAHSVLAFIPIMLLILAGLRFAGAPRRDRGDRDHDHR
jgi:hypothetical protein